MPSSRIFVSYACVGDEPGSTIGKQLVRDIRATGTEAVADHETISDEKFMLFLNQELPQCGYLIFVQTPVSLRSLRVQAAVNMALTLVEQQRMRVVLRVIAVPLQGMDSQPLLRALRTFDASMDYPRAREQLFIELGLIKLSSEDSFLVQSPLLAPGSFASVGGNLPPQPPGPVMPRQSSSFGSNPPPPPSSPVMPRQPMQPGSYPPLQPPGPSMPGAFQPVPAPAGMPGGNPPPFQGYSQAVPPLPPGRPIGTGQKPDKVRSKAQKTLFSRPLKPFQTSISAQPDKPSIAAAETMLEDRPLPLKTTRKTIIRWIIIIGVLLLIILVALLIFFLVYHHSPGLSPHHSGATPTPHRPGASPTPHRPAKQ